MLGVSIPKEAQVSGLSALSRGSLNQNALRRIMYHSIGGVLFCPQKNAMGASCSDIHQAHLDYESR